MSLLQLQIVIGRGGRGGGRGGGYHIALSNLMMQCSLKSSDSVYCSLYCALCSFREYFATLKLKHALWFYCCNLVTCSFLGMEGELTHIQEFLRQCRNVLPLKQNCSKYWSPSKLGCYERLLVISVNPREPSAYLKMECNFSCDF